MDTQRKAVLEIPETAAKTLIQLGDGDAALLYLYLRTEGTALETAPAAKALGRTEAEIACAAARLRELGLFPDTARPLPPPEELPEYRSEEIARRCREEEGFQSVIHEAQKRLGHMLSGAELRTLFGIYDHLGLPPEVILLLINHCAQRYARRYGEGRRPTMRYIEREAYAWANRELLTLEMAENYISRQDAREQGTEQVRRSLGLCGRALSATERRYIEGWLDLGFPPETIELAYDRTVTNTGALKWKYMDSILQSWSQRGWLRPEEIRRQDHKPGQESRERTGIASGDGEQARMERMLEKLRGK